MWKGFKHSKALYKILIVPLSHSKELMLVQSNGPFLIDKQIKENWLTKIGNGIKYVRKKDKFNTES